MTVSSGGNVMDFGPIGKLTAAALASANDGTGAS
jgi:hypothetical protein